MKLLSWDQETKRQVFIGITITILGLVFIQPLLAVLGKVLLYLAKYCWVGYLRSFLEIVSYRAPEIPLHDLLVDAAGVIPILIFVSSIMVVVSRRRLARFQKKHEEWHASGAHAEPPSLDSKHPPLWAVTTLGCLTFVLYLFKISNTSLELKAMVAFNNRITILAEVASDQEIRSIQADFAKMKDPHDYLAVNNKFQEIGKAHKIELKPLPLLWFFK